ncbi:uncharacterized protein LOC120435202 isoform X2 [Oreochromis aureus]|uniref:uncharacterized protein LOC120435202 isoform X2 n=1 Tax=Oreochromis aureus TaxID=47969 RepID=UPI00195474AA|nr:uncharacterized protein LOC120435202 isoform X2 [Oreochromis aureus]
MCQNFSMKVFRPLVCFIFLALQDAGYSGFVSAETPIYTEMEGKSITAECTFSLTGRRRLFCTGKCEEGNILIETTDDTAQNGRYRIKYKAGFYPVQKTVLNVSITQLRRSDSGMYRCSLDRILGVDSNKEFEIVVTDASVTSKPKSTVQPSSVSTFFSSASMTTATVTTSAKTPTSQSLNSISGSTTPSPASSSTSKQTQTPLPNLVTVGTLPVVALILITVLSVALLIFCKKRRASKAKGPPVETDPPDITTASQLYEEIREGDRLSNLPPEGVFSIYTTAKCPQGNRVESTDDYSLVTCPQNKSEENLSKIAATNGAPCGHAHVLYSASCVHFSTANHTKDASPPLYSTVGNHQ